MKNKTQPYLAGRFFDSISSGLFMMALPWGVLSEPKMGTFVALVSLSCTAISFLTTPFFSTFSGPTLTKSTPRAQSMDSIGHGFGGVHCLLVRV